MTADAERLAAIQEKLEPHFADIAYLCTRSWEAWQYGTMTEDDFIAADQDDEFMLDLAETVAKLVAAERDAEKERAKDFEAMLDGADEIRRALIAERDALRARIDAADAGISRLRDAVRDLRARADAPGWGARGDWWRGHFQGLRDAATDIESVLADSRFAALAGDQPEATPEVTPEPCMNTIGPSSNGGRWGACSLPEGHWRDGSDCRDESAPEPPHLDPYPWVNHRGQRYSAVGMIPSDHFDPRPADENGKAYSYKQEDYPS